MLYDLFLYVLSKESNFEFYLSARMTYQKRCYGVMMVFEKFTIQEKSCKNEIKTKAAVILKRAKLKPRIGGKYHRSRTVFYYRLVVTH